MEDLLLGTGTADQVRGDVTLPITRMSIDFIFNDIEQIKSLNTSKIKQIIFTDTDGKRYPYDYIASSTLTANDDDVLLPTSGIGRWILRRENNTQIETTGTGPGSAAESSHAGIPTGFILTTIYSDDNLIPGTGASYQYTGTTILAKAGNWPDADGFYYDVDGKQFQIYDTANLPIGINTQAGTSYTLVKSDAYISGGKTAVRTTSDSNVIMTLPAATTVNWEIGAIINFLQGGLGVITISPAVGVTVNGEAVTRGIHHSISLVKVAANVWNAIGGTDVGVNTPVVITLSNQTLSVDNATCGILLNSDGSLYTLEGAATESPSNWALPRVSNVGTIYEARMIYVSGDHPNQGIPTDVWVTLSDLRAWGVLTIGTTLNFVGTLEIRNAATLAVQATCAIDLTSVFVP